MRCAAFNLGLAGAIGVTRREKSKTHSWRGHRHGPDDAALHRRLWPGSGASMQHLVLHQVNHGTGQIANQGQAADLLEVPEKVNLLQPHGSHTGC